MGIFGSPLRMKRLTSVGTPPANTDSLYFKSDGNLYVKNPSGTERLLVPIPDQLHNNPTLDSSVTSTSGGGGSTVAPHEAPDGWSWFFTTSGRYWESDDVETKTGSGKSAKIALTTSPTSQAILTSSVFAVTPGAVITVGAWTRATGPRALLTIITSTPSGNPDFFGTEVATSDSEIVKPGTTWQKLTHSFVVPAGHTKARLFLRGDAGFGAGTAGTLWFDETESNVQILPAVLGDIAVYREIASDISMNNPTSWSTLPSGADRTALTTTFVKQSANTKLLVSGSASIGNASGVAQMYNLGLKIGSSTYALARTVMPQATSYATISGAGREISGLASGSYTIEPIFASSAATQMYFGSNYATISYTVREV